MHSSIPTAGRGISPRPHLEPMRGSLPSLSGAPSARRRAAGWRRRPLSSSGPRRSRSEPERRAARALAAARVMAQSGAFDAAQRLLVTRRGRATRRVAARRGPNCCADKWHSHPAAVARLHRCC